MSLQPADTVQPLDNIVEESSRPTTSQHTPNDSHAPPVPASPTAQHRQFNRRGSTASRVDVGFFDPQGVQSLERTISRMTSNNGDDVPSSPVVHKDAKHDASSGSSVTLGEGQHNSFDLEKTLRSIAQKRDDSSIPTRELGVSFENLEVTGIGAAASYMETLGSMLNPLNKLELIRNLRHPPTKQILSGLEGVVRPGEMLLVLGRPGSGCSSLLKTLANQTDEFHSVSGEVHYDSLTPHDVATRFRGDVQYSPEDDVHFPTLTVDQTLKFAAKTRAPQERTRMGETRTKYVDFLTEMLQTIFGLTHVKDTPVGDAAIRGVSGGEKKRVSISEALATRSRINSWDNSTRGLDASTALEFGRALRIATDIDRLTTIVSIYQAGQTLYSLFDKVAVLDEGKLVYFGAADRAQDYFYKLGYEPANRQTTPDFLVSVTDPLGRIPRKDFKGPRPKTADEFAKAFKDSEEGRLNREDIKAYKDSFVGDNARKDAFKESAKLEHAEHTRKSSPYTISIPMQIRAVMLRRVQILKGNSTATVFNLISFIIQGVIIGTVFLQMPESTSAFFSRGGVLFFSLLFCALSSMAEIPSLFSQRAIVLRHQKAALYHPAIEAMALTLVDAPIALITTLPFGILMYFITRLQQSAGQFFIFYLFIYTMTLVMKAWFRAVAAYFKTEAVAQAFAGMVLLMLVLYTGYAIPKPSMIGALRWITYINPIRYGFEGLVGNEFHTLNGECAQLVPTGPGYEGITIANQVCATVGSVAGQSTVDGNRFIALSYDYYYSNLWMNFGIVIAFGVGFLTLLFVFTEYRTSASYETSRVLFKRGSKPPTSLMATDAGDLEKARVEEADTTGADADQREAEKAVQEQAKMTDIFSWQHLQYTVDVAEGKRRLLDDVSGYVIPGKLTALMGESGAGKTTLLNVLAQRTDTGVVTGDRFVNGQPLPADFQAQTGYCQQMDTHVPTDTVRDALFMSAKLRQPQSVPIEQKKQWVETCLKMCGLEAFAEAAVGSLGIEHRKRTTIGVELASKPKLLLFLDEPTSGLDSQSAWAIMDFLRSLANSGQAILCTIHQPSAELFQVFDRLLLLKKGGQTVYFGDLGHNAETLLDYFERNGSRHCEPGENPAEFMLDVIGAGATANTSQDWYDVWRRSEEARNVQTKIEEIHAEGRSRPPVESTLHSEFATSWFYQFTELWKRDVTFRYRDSTYLLAKLILQISGGLFIGFTFWKADNTQQGTQNKLFAIFMGLIVSVPVANQLQVPYLNMRSIYEIRERPSKMYHWSALVTAQYLAEVPWNILGSSLFFFCWYWTVGFPSSRAGYTYLLLCFITPWYYTSFAMAVASAAPNAEIAGLLYSLLFSFVLNFNGVIQPFRQLGWWQWMYRLSPYTYLVEGLLGQAIGKTSIECSSNELAIVSPFDGQTCQEFFSSYVANNGGYVANRDATSDCQFCSTATTDEFLGAQFNISYDNRWRDLGIFCAFILFNIFMIYTLSYWFRFKTWSVFGSFKSKKPKPANDTKDQPDQGNELKLDVPAQAPTTQAS